MAKIADLAAALSPVDGRPADAIEHVARRCREAGLLPNVGRGKPAENATTADAVNLLIALNGADNAKDAALHVKLFRDMQPSVRHDVVVSEIFETAPIAAVWREPLQAAPTFGEALEKLIAISPTLLTFWIGLWPLVGAGAALPAPWKTAAALGRAGIQVSMTRLAGDWPSSALIRIFHMEYVEDAETAESPWRGRPRPLPVVDFECHYTRSQRNYGTPENPEPRGADRDTTSSFSTWTIAAVIEAMMGKEFMEELYEYTPRPGGPAAELEELKQQFLALLAEAQST